jgi:hypothetical protein
VPLGAAAASRRLRFRELENNQPEQAYQAAGQNKVLWIVLTVVLGFIGSAIYLLAIRRDAVNDDGRLRFLPEQPPWGVRSPCGGSY